jgi:Na+-translocating ferredoxin:NAD+ oxidoreductase RnfG subunit
VFLVAEARCEVFHTVDEALAIQFPGAEVKRESMVLSEEQLALASRLAGQKMTEKIFRPYRARKSGGLVGTAYFDVHRVRTLKETLMVVIDSEDRIAAIRLLAFMEPGEYIPRDRWYHQFLGRNLDREMHLHRGIDGVTGATLTARATSDAVRRILAAHLVLTGAERP